MLPMIRINISLTNHLDMWKTYYVLCQLLMWNYYFWPLFLQVFKLQLQLWLCIVIAPLHSDGIHINFNFKFLDEHNSFFLKWNFFQHLSFLCTLINPKNISFPQKVSKPWWSSQVNVYYLGGSLHKQVCIDAPFVAQILGRSTWINVSEIYKISQYLLCWIINMSVHMVILGCICHICTYFQSPKRLRLHFYQRYIYFDDGSFAKVFCREQLFCYNAWLNWKTSETPPSSSRESFEWICCLLMEYHLLGYFAKFTLPVSVICIITLMLL